VPDALTPHPRIVPVILSGGAGTRLWPLSREAYPKQLLSLTEDLSLLQITANRVSVDAGFEPPLLVCNSEHRFIVAEQLRHIAVKPKAIVLESILKRRLSPQSRRFLLRWKIMSRAVCG